MNNCSFTGHLTDDPKLSTTLMGDVNVRFFLAVDRRHGKKQKEASREANRPTADFIPCKAWRGAATTISSFCKKGDYMAVTGAIRTGTYEKDGTRKFSWELEVRDFEFRGRKNNGKSEPKGTDENADTSVFESGEDVTDSEIPDGIFES